MTFDKKFLLSLGIADDLANKIFDAHLAHVDLLKSRENDYDSLKKQLDLANQKIAALSAVDYEELYRSQKNELDTLKSLLNDNAKKNSYSEALKKAGVPEKRISAILKVTDFDKIEFDENFALKDLDKEIQAIKTEYGGLIPSSKITGFDPETPPLERSDNLGRSGIAAEIQRKHLENMYGVLPQNIP